MSKFEYLKLADTIAAEIAKWGALQVDLGRHRPISRVKAQKCFTNPRNRVGRGDGTQNCGVVKDR